MKYIMMCLAALVISLMLGAAATMAVAKIRKKRFSRLQAAGRSVVFGVLILLIISVGYLSVYYHADEAAYKKCLANPKVRVEEIDGGYYFDGPGADTALVFYPGAKVAAKAYAPLMTALAEQGIDCFIAKVPFNMAMFGKNLAGKFMDSYAYDNWVMAGHSMGGIVASGYATDHPDEVSAVVMLASYPTEQIPEGMVYCSINGDQDGCLNREAYEDSRRLWPASAVEKCIEGGNHAQFGAYGFQEGDEEAAISAEEQQAITVDAIVDAVDACSSETAADTEGE